MLFQKLNLILTPTQRGASCPCDPHLPDEDIEAQGGGRIRTRPGDLQRPREGCVYGWGSGGLSEPQGETLWGMQRLGPPTSSSQKLDSLGREDFQPQCSPSARPPSLWL